MPWLRTYVTICASVLAGLFLLLILLVSLVDLGLSSHGTTALFLGVLLTVALAMGLMGLVFHSGHSGGDRASRAPPQPPLGPAPPARPGP